MTLTVCFRPSRPKILDSNGPSPGQRAIRCFGAKPDKHLGWSSGDAELMEDAVHGKLQGIVVVIDGFGLRPPRVGETRAEGIVGLAVKMFFLYHANHSVVPEGKLDLEGAIPASFNPRLTATIASPRQCPCRQSRTCPPRAGAGATVRAGGSPRAGVRERPSRGLARGSSRTVPRDTCSHVFISTK
jgi:hypothetical protein